MKRLSQENKAQSSAIDSDQMIMGVKTRGPRPTWTLVMHIHDL